ncbi:hypothetical protein V6N11_058686 [Hibiscus sabdariffa]|uniref:DUF4283 domain-containing protein n=1 Tax=Hibiscus sabdariffa TaxID=183260 RepID=A0ABR2U5Q9_9ROSI
MVLSPLVSFFDSSSKVSLTKEKSDEDEELNVESGPPSKEDRVTWIEVSGLPLHCWNYDTLERVTGLWGLLEAYVSSKEDLNQSMEAGVGEKPDLGAKSSNQESLKLVKDGKCVISGEVGVLKGVNEVELGDMEKSDEDEELNIESGPPSKEDKKFEERSQSSPKVITRSLMASFRRCG